MTKGMYALETVHNIAYCPNYQPLHRHHCSSKPLWCGQCGVNAAQDHASLPQPLKLFPAGRLLVGHLFNKKEPQQEGDEHAMEDTFKRLLSKLQMFHTISRSTPEVPLSLTP